VLKEVEVKMEKKLEYVKWKPVKDEYILQWDNFYSPI